MKKYFTFGVIFILVACSSAPNNVKPVDDFDLTRYTGTWYEIARLDHRFERGLEKITATYSLNDDGSVKVVNKGFSTDSSEWEEAIGKAKFASQQDIGHLKVSFFGPFYGHYVIFELDQENYQYAFVSSGENYLWFLSRSPIVSEELKARFLASARKAGYDIEALIFVQH